MTKFRVRPRAAKGASVAEFSLIVTLLVATVVTLARSLGGLIVSALG